MGARQQQFVQYCLRLGYGPESSFKDAHSRLYADTDVAFDSLIQRANSSLHALSLVLRSRKDEQSGDTVWAVVNTKADDISKLATPYAHAEMAYMKKIIELIVTSESDEYSITNFDALNVTKALAEKVKLMQKDAQDLLSRFTDDGWLVQYSNGRFALGSRALLELDTYLRNQYPDHIRECHVCHEIVTAGQACADCNASLHTRCASNFFVGRTSPSCPSCGAHWDSQNTFGPGNNSNHGHSKGQPDDTGKDLPPEERPGKMARTH